MAYWLFKEEPGHYNFSQLEQDRTTVWDGVTNALARKHLRSVSPGDAIFYYHTGSEKAVVGIMEAISAPQADPQDVDPNSVVLSVKAIRRLTAPVTLARIKADPTLANWDLIRLSRLSIVPVSPEQWERVLEISRRVDSDV